MRMTRLGLILLFFALAIVRAGQEASADPIIDTRIGIPADPWHPLGQPNTATYGQTFRVTGSETQLNSFSFWLDDYVGTTDFAAYIAPWTGSSISSVLYSSPMVSTTNNGGRGGFERFDFSTGGLQLDAGNQYVAFLSASNFFNGSVGLSYVEAFQPGNGFSSVYPLGDFVYFNNGSNFAALFSPWESIGCGGGCSDLAFVATFSEPSAAALVPEPASMLLVGTGLLGAGVRRWRQRRG